MGALISESFIGNENLLLFNLCRYKWIWRFEENTSLRRFLSQRYSKSYRLYNITHNVSIAGWKLLYLTKLSANKQKYVLLKNLSASEMNTCEPVYLYCVRMLWVSLSSKYFWKKKYAYEADKMHIFNMFLDLLSIVSRQYFRLFLPAQFCWTLHSKFSFI